MKETRKTPAFYIKKALKKEFPGMKFSCRYESFAGGDSVNVERVGGSSEKEVKAIADQFQMGDFDGMIDMYEYRDTDKPAEQLAKYVFCKREPAEGEEQAILEEMKEKTSRTFEDIIGMINKEEGLTTRTKYDRLKMSLKQHLQEAGYTYEEAGDKAWIVYQRAYKTGVFAF